jgi:hypothetical protein
MSSSSEPDYDGEPIPAGKRRGALTMGLLWITMVTFFQPDHFDLLDSRGLPRSKEWSDIWNVEPTGLRSFWLTSSVV